MKTIIVVIVVLLLAAAVVYGLVRPLQTALTVKAAREDEILAEFEGREIPKAKEVEEVKEPKKPEPALVKAG